MLKIKAKIKNLNKTKNLSVIIKIILSTHPTKLKLKNRVLIFLCFFVFYFSCFHFLINAPIWCDESPLQSKKVTAYQNYYKKLKEDSSSKEKLKNFSQKRQNFFTDIFLDEAKNNEENKKTTLKEQPQKLTEKNKTKKSPSPQKASAAEGGFYEPHHQK